MFTNIQKGRGILLNTMFGENDYSIFNVYAPNEKKERNRFF